MAQKLLLNSFGNHQGISLSDCSPEDLKNGEIRIQVEASPINPADINYIQGTYGVKPELPATIGIEGSGRVIESKDENIQEGVQVIFIKRVGTWQSEIICDASSVIPLPVEICPLQAAMLKVNPMTAWRLLTAYTNLEEGDYVIQNAANSGVGQCVIQIAKILGFKTINLVRREELIEPLLKLGAEHVLIDDEKVREKVVQITGEDKLPKLALNAVGGDSALRLMDCLSEQGDHVTYGAMSMRSLKVPNKFLIFKRICLHGLWVTKDLEELPHDEVVSIYQHLASWIKEDKLSQNIEATYPLEQYSKAIEHSQQAKRNGKILFQPA